MYFLHSPLPLILIFAGLVAAISTSDPSPTLTLAYQLLISTSAPTPFAHLSRTSDTNQADPKALSSLSIGTFALTSYTPPSLPKDATAFVRISASSPASSPSSTTLTTLSSLSDPSSTLIRIVLNTNSEVVAVSVHRKYGDGDGREGLPWLEVVRAAEEPRAVLNRPVVLDAEGKVEAEKVEKTLLQKYWWVGAAALMLLLMGGGDGK